MKKPIIINLAGAPGAGKSTGAAYIFYKLKAAGINAELITEFAKDKTWEHNNVALSNQIYILGKQYYRIARCMDQVDVIVTDSPILLSILYGEHCFYSSELNSLVKKLWQENNNLLYFINRVKKYNPAGRNQTAEESDALSMQLKKLLSDNDFNYEEYPGSIEGYDQIVADIIAQLNEMKVLR